MRSTRIIIPPPLSPNAKIAVIAPAGPSQPDRTQAGIAILQQAGYQIELHPDWLQPPETEVPQYLAGSDEARVADLNRVFSDPAIEAVMVTRGGYGTMRLLDKIQWSNFTHPKWFIGFSDTTALSLALFQHLRWASLSGPVISSTNELNLSGVTFQTFFHWAQNPTPVRLELKPARTGTARGKLIPGCLSLFHSLIGTPYFPKLNKAILVIEDIGEEAYKVDRMLTHLSLAGAFDRVSAIIMGRFCNKFGEFDEKVEQQTVTRLLELTAVRGIPIASQLPYGHFTDRITLPLGATASIRNDTLKITLPDN